MIHFRKYDYDQIVNNSSRHRNKYYSNIIFTFDIETTSMMVTPEGVPESFDLSKSGSYYDRFDKVGWMYIWMFSINDQVLYGRTWDEFREFLKILSGYILGCKIIYVHNLSFEFQYLRNVFDKIEVFARSERHVIYARVEEFNVEFRCSYLLTNMSLDKVTKGYNLTIHKKTGDLDYSKIRTRKTKLTRKEMGYCEYDCLVVYYLIKKHLEEYGQPFNIPLTQTGRVRRVCQEMYRHDGEYKEKLRSILPKTIEEFSFILKSFQGGYTHANAIYVNEIVRDVQSKDISSSYPTVMVAEKYPMSYFVPSSVKTLEEMLSQYAYILEIHFHHIYATTFNHYLSYSKGRDARGVVVDNGRIVQAEDITYVLTDVDLRLIRKCYEFEYTIIRAVRARKGYLDKKYVEKALEFYVNKTKYKNVKGYENNYIQSKQYVNSLYGMMVTNTIRDQVHYEDGQWSTEIMTHDQAQELLTETIHKKNTFLSWAWGVFVTAYARRNLWTMILVMDEDVVYCDTDSVKYIGDHEAEFSAYNKKILRKLEKALDYHGIDHDMIRPKSPDGEEHPLGIFDNERPYAEFKTLGAKKYAYRYEGEDKLHITVSGVSKEGASALKSLDDFRDGFCFDYQHSGKNLLTYNDEQTPIKVTDYQGNVSIITDRYGLNIHPTTYVLGLDIIDPRRYLDATTHLTIGGFQ